MRVAHWREERGVVGAIATLCLAIVLGMSALVIDVGNSWQQRRHAVTTTDSAALAATQEYAEGGIGCSSTANGYVLANNPDAIMTRCDHVPRSGDTPGRVTVEAEVPVSFIFAPIFGIDNTSVSSSTTVSYGPASAVTGGHRPMALCEDTLGDLGAEAGDGNIYRIFFNKGAPTYCGGSSVPGNWGLLDFDGGNNSNNDLKQWTAEGYPGTVSIGDVIEGEPGAFSNALTSSLNTLLAGEVFTLPVYDTVTGNGASAEFHIVNFASVQLHGYKAHGSENTRYMDLEFLESVVQGDGGGPADDFGSLVLGICAIDAVTISSCIPTSG